MTNFFSLQKWIWLLLLTAAFSSCRKNNSIVPESNAVMQYLNLQNTKLLFEQSMIIDINKDGTADFLFATLLVGDPVLKRDRKQFYAYSLKAAYLLNDNEDQSPVFNKGEAIADVVNGFQWYEVSAIVLAEKIVPLTGAPFWTGSWKATDHKYLPVQVKKNEKLYNGWIELSFDSTAENLILHKAAICTVPGKPIKAGA